MALNPEEFHKKRQQSQQKREQQLRQLKIKLIVAGIVLVACAVLIFFVSRRASQQPPEDPTTAPSVAPTQPTETQPPEETVAPTEPTTTIHFACAGDLNVNDRTVVSGDRTDGYTAAFLDVAHLLADADIAAVNLEGTLFGTPYGTASNSAPQALVDSLARAGVDLVQLANSYSIRHGLLGLASTIRGVRSAGMEPLGVYATAEEAAQGKGYTIREVAGIRIAFVAFTKGMDGMALPKGSENCVNVLYEDYDRTYQTVNTEGITRVLRDAAKEKPDITIAMLHWGSEFNNTISSTQQSICSLMQEEGVDVIVGTHSHYVQKMEFDPETGTFVAYSLGDFCGDAQRAGSQYSVVLDLTITRDNATGLTSVTGYDYTPIYILAPKNQPLQVLRIREAMIAYEAEYIDRVDRTVYEDMKYALERIKKRIAGE